MIFSIENGMRSRKMLSYNESTTCNFLIENEMRLFASHFRVTYSFPYPLCHSSLPLTSAHIPCPVSPPAPRPGSSKTRKKYLLFLRLVLPFPRGSRRDAAQTLCYTAGPTIPGEPSRLGNLFLREVGNE